MIRKKDLKAGLLVWWTAKGDLNNWSFPAIVTIVDGDRFKLRNLNDFKETDFLTLNDVTQFRKSMGHLAKNTIKKELRLCTIDEVKNYFEKQIQDQQRRISDLVKVLDDARETLSEYKSKTTDFLKFLSRDGRVKVGSIVEYKSNRRIIQAKVLRIKDDGKLFLETREPDRRSRNASVMPHRVTLVSE